MFGLKLKMEITLIHILSAAYVRVMTCLIISQISPEVHYKTEITCQVRIQDLVKGGGPASEAESCRHSEAESRKRSEHSAAGVQGPLKGPGSFWVFDAQICILTHCRDSFSLIFDIYFDTKS